MLPTDPHQLGEAWRQCRLLAAVLPGPLHLERRIKETPTSGREPATPLVSFEQANPQDVFKLLDALGHGGWACVNTLRGFGKASRSSRREKGSNGHDIHKF